METRNRIPDRTLRLCLLVLCVTVLSPAPERADVPGSARWTLQGRAFAQEAKDAKDAGKEQSAVPSQEPSPCPECPDPAKVVLSGLEDKRKALALAEDALKEERKQLEKYKEEIDEQLSRLEDLKRRIEADLALLDQKKTARELEKEAAFEAKMDKLVKVYAGMKPKEAGEIINKMDIDVARQILSRMRETSAAQILAFVNTERAAKISEGIVYPR
jgi:flagellar motility protein MotE (MotC chaperone)